MASIRPALQISPEKSEKNSANNFRRSFGIRSRAPEYRLKARTASPPSRFKTGAKGGGDDDVSRMAL